MSGKKTMGWRSILLGLAAAMAVDLLGVLLVTLLTVRGAVGEGSGLPLLAGAALCAAFTGGMIAGGGGVGAAGALLHTGLFGVLLVLICFGAWADPAGNGAAGRSSFRRGPGESGEAPQKRIGQISQKTDLIRKRTVRWGKSPVFGAEQIWVSHDGKIHYI